MKEILDFLKTNKVFYLATSTDNQPHVRAMGFVMNCNGKLTFCTSKQKAMYTQLVTNPQVEICCIDAQYNTLRVCGKAVFCTTTETQRQALEAMPTLANMYAVNDGKFEIFSLDNVQATCQTMSGEKRTIQS